MGFMCCSSGRPVSLSVPSVVDWKCWLFVATASANERELIWFCLCSDLFGGALLVDISKVCSLKHRR